MDQELYTIGYYIVTVDGSRVWVDFYSSSKGGNYDPAISPIPPLGFDVLLREAMGYSLNGEDFMIDQGDSTGGAGFPRRHHGPHPVGIQWRHRDRLPWTANAEGCTHRLGRSPVDRRHHSQRSFHTLGHGRQPEPLPKGGRPLADADEPDESDTFALALSYDPKAVRPSQLVSGKFALAVNDESGAWVNAVDINIGGTKAFKDGPWKAGYALGTYGVHPSTSTVWAVINHDGEFVAKQLS